MTDWLTINDIKYFEIELSNYCNAKCPSCIREFSPVGSLNNSNISLAQIKNLIGQLPNPKKIEFYFGGTSGDPMMNPDIVEIFEYCAENLRMLSMDTNASLRSTEVWKQMGKISERTGACVIFSVDGLEDTNHIYRIDTNWKLIMRNIKTYIDSGGYCDWKFLIFKHNEHQVEEAKELAKKLGVSKFTVEPSSREMINNIVELTDLPLSKKRSFNSLKDVASSITCRSLKTNYMYISSNYTLYPCCYFHSNYNSTEDIKCDLNSMSLRSAIENIKYKNLVSSWKSQCPSTCKTHCNENKYWEKIISSEKL
jgi:MoaA/NifB/PqqE/SkfB family radical SAM enzyme